MTLRDACRPRVSQTFNFLTTAICDVVGKYFLKDNSVTKNFVNFVTSSCDLLMFVNIHYTA